MHTLRCDNRFIGYVSFGFFGQGFFSYGKIE